jgi:predicted RNA-binding protein YlxR (DUF448 family)
MSPKEKSVPGRHIPQRSCVACREVRPKRELVRLVCVTGGGVQVDDTGKKAGRGAYLCRRRECWDTGIRGGRLEHALKTSIVREEYNQLMKYAEEMWSAGSQEGAG